VETVINIDDVQYGGPPYLYTRHSRLRSHPQGYVRLYPESIRVNRGKMRYGRLTGKSDANLYKQGKLGPGCQGLTKYIRHSEYGTIAHTPVLKFFYSGEISPMIKRI